MKMRADACRDFISRLLIGFDRQILRIDTEKIVIAHSWMDVEMQVRDFLKSRFAN